MANNENEQLTAAPSAGAADEMEGKAGASLTDSVPAAPVFTVSGLQFAYDHGRVPIFDGLDLAIPEGQITTLIGQTARESPRCSTC